MSESSRWRFDSFGLPDARGRRRRSENRTVGMQYLLATVSVSLERMLWPRRNPTREVWLVAPPRGAKETFGTQVPYSDREDAGGVVASQISLAREDTIPRWATPFTTSEACSAVLCRTEGALRQLLGDDPIPCQPASQPADPPTSHLAPPNRIRHPPAESPLERALAAFNAYRPPKPNPNENCTGFAKRWADVAPPSYRPSFGYLGEANPDFYGNPVAVKSLKFVGAPLPWEEQGGDEAGRSKEDDSGAAEMPEIKRDGGWQDIKATGGKAKAATGTSAKSRAQAKNNKGKATPAQSTKKTPTSAGPEAPAHTVGHQTRSMTKGAGNPSTSSKVTSEPDMLDARPKKRKRARLSLPQPREAPSPERKELEKLDHQSPALPPLSIVCARSSDTAIDENETNAAAAADDEVEANLRFCPEGDAAPAPLEASTRENANEIPSSAQADLLKMENGSTNSERDAGIAITAVDTGSAGHIFA
ncbi:hypothetical protein BDN71DRAFT_1436195 [Pleurotus eryngii]|uniref:Uncharacterized protein n=1 Tax=Pleurotus eryngii TaxID=5323 RepID=A0A9P6D2A5_PLEER|nr:hypothetical protein BDN71DRAFT_1436195 [Pleurotus eryngii]